MLLNHFSYCIALFVLLALLSPQDVRADPAALFTSTSSLADKTTAPPSSTTTVVRAAPILPSNMPTCTATTHVCPALQLFCPDACPSKCYLDATDPCCFTNGTILCHPPAGNSSSTTRITPTYFPTFNTATATRSPSGMSASASASLLPSVAVSAAGQRYVINGGMFVGALVVLVASWF